MPLPNKEQFTGLGVTEQGFKNAQDQLVDFLKNEVASSAVVDSLADEIKRKISTFFYAPNGNKVIKESNSALFAVEISVKEGEVYIIDTNSLIGSVAGRIYIADSASNVLFMVDSNQVNDQPYVIKIPVSASKLYVNCVNEYSNRFSVSKVPKGVFELFYNNNNFQQFTFYYRPDGGKVVKGSHTGLFSVEYNVQPGEFYLLDTHSFGLAAAYYTTDAQSNVISTIRTEEVPQEPFIVKIPVGASKLYVNCSYSYSSKFNLKKIPKGFIAFIDNGGKKEDYSFFYSADSINIKREGNQGLFSIELVVQPDQYYLLDTQGQGIAGEWYITDTNGVVLDKNLSNGLANGEQIVKIPEQASKLYINCVNTYADKFYLERVPRVLAENIGSKVFIVKETGCFYVVSNGNISKYAHPDFFSSIVSVIAGEKYDIETHTFGIALEYVVTDINGVVLDYKNSTGAEVKYTLKMPDGSAKLYVNCANEYSNVLSIDFSKEAPEPAKKVSDYFPNVSHFGKLQEKCPNFYRKFKDKNQDVTVVLTGTSLTQGNLYASDRDDASNRPAALHTHDLASSIFDVLVKHWDGQKYRRYDHTDLVYSNSTWTVTNNIGNGTWDDYAHIKNGLTKTTTDANASVSITIPLNAWQFNFVYRSDSQSGNCTVSIAEGNSKVELFDGTNWVEANGFVFTMYESPATETKGNTQYQKRLKMRCKNKDTGGINSIGSSKQITISKGNNSNRFNVVGFEWSPREYMLSLVNGARGGFEWGDPNGNRLDKYQDTDIWSFNPDLLLAEVTIINWGASEPTSLSKDPLHYVNIAKRAYFNEFDDMPTSLHAKSEAYSKCDVIFYGDTLAASSAVAGAWDSSTYEPKFGTVVEAATNGLIADNRNIGKVKTNFENYEAVESYMASKDYLFIPILSAFKNVSEQFYGSYWQGMQASSKVGETLTIDGVHFNDNGARLFSSLICPIFENI
ncbi:hypothetical protein ABTM70_06970 [Acinetobacter baumannii]